VAAERVPSVTMARYWAIALVIVLAVVSAAGVIAISQWRLEVDTDVGR
jgi:hypothetical protein